MMSPPMFMRFFVMFMLMLYAAMRRNKHGQISGWRQHIESYDL